MDGDDLDERFNALVAQIDAGEQRRMRTAATKGVRGPRRARARRRRWPAVWAVVAVVVVAGAVVTTRPDLLSGISPAVRQASPAAEETSPVLAETEPTTEETEPTPGETRPAPVASGNVGPFDGSPAERYAEGAAGIVLPQARAMGGLSKKAIAKGLQQAKALLAAAFLDRATLMGGRPEAYIAALDPAQRAEFRANLDVRTKNGHHSRDMLASFAPGTAELVTDVIKTTGRITLADDPDGVTVKVNQLFVYAIQRPGAPDTAMRLVVHAKGEVLLRRDVVWSRVYQDGATPARCDVNDGFIHAFYADSPPDTTPRESGGPSDPYDLSEQSGRKRAEAECTDSQPT
ncbi:hypothetical protein ACFXJ8_04330 [Nonomuraea sp. NPDC059194]|uniref:hypothetical protein n=1 Tax=Nonomuraea sp. NPDC059194 TaxID=3346764 RepID=UPI00368235D9